MDDITLDELAIPDFLKRKQKDDTSMTTHDEKLCDDMDAAHKEAQHHPKSETTQMLEQAMSVQTAPTVEELIGAIRKLTAEIDDRTQTRAALRSKLRKMAGEI